MKNIVITFRRFLMIAAPLVAFLIAFVPDLGSELSLSHSGRATIAIMIWMSLWWIFEVIPVAATALIPLVCFPLFHVMPLQDAASPYANRLIFLFLGGFLIAICMQRWNLHKRFALLVLKWVGTNPSHLIAGFMGITAFLSMWVSNTATVVMMLPIASSIIKLVKEDEACALSEENEKNFSLCLLLGLAYSASIGGLGTLIGTPPNALLAAFLQQRYGYVISFSAWMQFALPLVLLFIPAVWFVLTKIVFPLRIKNISLGKEIIERELVRLGKIRPQEIVIIVVFATCAFMWMFRPVLTTFFPALAGLDDAAIAIIAALLLFLIPAGRGKRLLEWQDTHELPWNVLILFGGGLSMAQAISVSGVSEFIGHIAENFSQFPLIVLMVVIVAIVIALTEMASNTATAAALLPIIASIAEGVGVSPLVLLVPAAVAASCAFMMPIATPPNALVYSSGKVRVTQMIKAGMCVHPIGISLITLLSYFALAFLLGGDLTVMP